MDIERKDIICQACKKGYAIIGDCATECSHCGASLDMDTGEPFRHTDGTIVYCGCFGGRHIP